MTNPKIVSLTGHGKIRRKPLPYDAKLLVNQHSNSYRLAKSKSEPILELSSDTLCSINESLEVDATEPFPTYDTDYDAPFSSSPVGRSTPRICVQPSFEDRTATRKLTHVDPRSFSSLSIPNSYENSSDINLNLNGSETSGVIQKRTSKLKGGYPSARYTNGSRVKKHPSPSKADLDKWDQIICDFPPAKSSGRNSQVCDHELNAYLHPNTALGFKSTNTKLQEPITKQDRGKDVDRLEPQALDTSRAAITKEFDNRNKGKKSFVSKHRNSKTKSRVGSRGGSQHSSNIAMEDDIMETDELQWDWPALIKKAT